MFDVLSMFYRRGELARCAGDDAKALALITSAMVPREISAASAIRADRPQELLARSQSRTLRSRMISRFAAAGSAAISGSGRSTKRPTRSDRCSEPTAAATR
jgi:hypothetical protein